MSKLEIIYVMDFAGIRNSYMRGRDMDSEIKDRIAYPCNFKKEEVKPLNVHYIDLGFIVNRIDYQGENSMWVAQAECYRFALEHIQTAEQIQSRKAPEKLYNYVQSFALVQLMPLNPKFLAHIVYNLPHSGASLRRYNVLLYPTIFEKETKLHRFDFW